MIPENMTGAGGRRAMNYVFEKAENDGYTIVVSAHPSRLIGQLLYADSAKYDMRKFNAASSNFNVIVVAECVADRFDFAHRLSLIDMQLKYADVVSLAEAVEYLDYYSVS